jgi:septum formation protein
MQRRLPHIVLASSSPRRRELLAEAGYSFEVAPPGDEAETDAEHAESAREMVARLAFQKAADVADRIDEGLVLGCDTVAECDGQILGKPQDAEHARRMLELLRGREHRAYSGLCLWPRPGRQYAVRVAVTVLRMTRIADAELEEYLRTGQWRGKAGAFGYQDGHDWLQILSGSESNVVGLPLELLAEMIEPYRASP